jgi:hypothetical protein
MVVLAVAAPATASSSQIKTTARRCDRTVRVKACIAASGGSGNLIGQGG